MKTMPKITEERDQGVTVTAAAAYLGVSLPTMRRYIAVGYIRRMGKSALVSCKALGDYIGYSASPEKIKQECLAAREAKKPGHIGSY